MRSVSKTKERSDLGVFSISDQLPFRKCQYWAVLFFSSASSFCGHVVLEPLQCKYGKSTPRIAPEPVLRAHLDPKWPGQSLWRLSPFNGDRFIGRTSRIVPTRRAFLHCQFSPPRFPLRRLSFCRKYSLLAADKAGNANLSHLTSG